MLAGKRIKLAGDWSMKQKGRHCVGLSLVGVNNTELYPVFLSLNFFRALSATPARPVPRSSSVVGSGTSALASIVEPGEKPVTEMVKIVFGGIPVP